MTVDVISKIERDIAAHASFDKKLFGLTILSLVVGTTVGLAVSKNLPIALFFMNPSTATVFILSGIIAYLAVARAVVRHTGLRARYFYAALFLICLVFCKFVTYQFASHGLLRDSFSFDSSGHNLSCFSLGFGASALVLLFSVFAHWKLNMAPSHRVRIISCVIAASAGLLAQNLFCIYLNFDHLLFAHFGQALGVCVFVLVFDFQLTRIWFSKSKLSIRRKN